MNNEKTKSEWEAQNKNNYWYYYNQYPFLLKNNFVLPLSENFLKGFYITSMNRRNLTPIKEILDNYSFLFSYFIANYEIEGTNKQFKSKPKIELVIDNIIPETKKVFTSISNSISNDIFNLKIVLILIIGLEIVNTIKK